MDATNVDSASGKITGLIAEQGRSFDVFAHDRVCQNERRELRFCSGTLRQPESIPLLPIISTQRFGLK